MTELAYVSRMAHLPVLDPEGSAVGRLDDVVLGPPPPGAPPPVRGFIVTVPGRRIFVNAGRVSGLDAGGVRLRQGELNLRKFSQRPSELLILHELLDSSVEGGFLVNDVGITPATDRGHGWDVAVVDLLAAGRRLPLPGRRRERRTVPWTDLRDLFGAEPDHYTHLRELHPADVAGRLQDLHPTERAQAASTLDDEQFADLLEELPEDVQAELLAQIELERAAHVLEAMDPDDAADLLGTLEQKQRAILLEAMQPDEAEPLRRLLRYSENTAGGLMTPEPLLFAPDATVADALAILRDPDVPAALAAQVFVVEPPTETPTGQFVGTCSFQRLLRERPFALLGECVDALPKPIRPNLSEAKVARILASYDLLALPVCDASGRMLGVVTVDDVLDHMLPDDWRAR